MAAEDWLPPYCFEDQDEDEDLSGISWYPRSPFRRTCKYCNQKELMWKKVDNAWKLFDRKGNQHDCKH